MILSKTLKVKIGKLSNNKTTILDRVINKNIKSINKTNLPKEKGGNLTPFKKSDVPWNKGVKGYSTKKKGQTQKAWNKGLSKKTDERVLQYCESRKGFKHTDKAKEKMIKKKLGIKRPDLSKILKGRPSHRKGKKHTKKAKWLIKQARLKQIFPLKDTSIEIKIKSFLDDLDIKYTQHKVIQIKHPYQCDFFLPKSNIIIEADGDYWHNYPIGNEIDHIRTKELIEKGFKVLRLWENQINKMSISDLQKVFLAKCQEEQATINIASNDAISEPKQRRMAVHLMNKALGTSHRG